MPEKEVIQRARRDEKEGKSASTQAGEFVREEMEHIREGKHGARSPEQAIAIGLSKARRAGVKLPPPRRGSKRTQKQAKRDLAKGSHRQRRPSPTRSRAVRRALKQEGRSAASHRRLSRQAKRAPVVVVRQPAHAPRKKPRAHERVAVVDIKANVLS